MILALLAACDSGSGSGRPAGQGTSRAAVSSAKTTGATAAPPMGLPPSPDTSHFERIPVEAAEKARASLAAFLDASATDMRAYHVFRRAVSCGDPFFRERRAEAEALFGPAGDTTSGPLGRLDAAVVAGNRQNIDKEAAAVRRALLALRVSFERDPARLPRVAVLLPQAAYWLGAIVAGSKPGVAVTPKGLVADAQGHLDAIEGMILFNHQYVSPNPEYGPAYNRTQARITALRKALGAAEEAGELSDRAALVVQTGHLGAELRALLGPSSDLWIPPPPAVSALSRPSPGGLAEPTSVLTLPRLRGPAASPAPGKQDSKDSHPVATWSGDAPMDRFARGDEKALSDEDRRGFDAAAKGRCFVCHAPPLFGVAAPPDFQGSSETTSLRSPHKPDPHFHDIDLSEADKKVILRFVRTALAEPRRPR